MSCPRSSDIKADQKLIVGNWKMNGLKADAKTRVSGIVAALSADVDVGYAVVLCPPLTLLSAVRQTLDDVYLCGEAVITVGAQDCHPATFGAYTGDISASMLVDAGASHVILGHSERRQNHSESDDLIAAKTAAAQAVGLTAIVCVGETEPERASGQHFEVVSAQIKGSLPSSATPANTVIAYEPVWAIGTGKTATAEDVTAMHAHIRGLVGPGFRILYGGSVKPANATEILATPNVDGVLVGGASLSVDDFVAIARAAP